ncbi:hypothetical protein MKEN_00744800 [Mycena kentingensis (nom. inval.)]|nr:hypothetical protein MKEN_00744800 [Mycena kentingensis (nom. inval.)]
MCDTPAPDFDLLKDFWCTLNRGKQFPRVSHLSIAYSQDRLIGDDNYTTFFSHFPALQHLHFHLPVQDDLHVEFLLSILDAGEETLLLPSLQSLSFAACSIISLDVIQGFLERHQNAGTPFRRLKMHFVREYWREKPPALDKAQLANFRAGGIEVELTADPPIPRPKEPEIVPVTTRTGLEHLRLR